MSDEELKDALDGLFAYDIGCTDSGIHDEELRARVIAEIHADLEPHQIYGRRLSIMARELYLSDDAIEQGYGLADIAEFCSWIDDRMRG